MLDSTTHIASATRHHTPWRLQQRDGQNCRHATVLLQSCKARRMCGVLGSWLDGAAARGESAEPDGRLQELQERDRYRIRAVMFANIDGS